MHRTNLVEFIGSFDALDVIPDGEVFEGGPEAQKSATVLVDLARDPITALPLWVCSNKKTVTGQVLMPSLLRHMSISEMPIEFIVSLEFSSRFAARTNYGYILWRVTLIQEKTRAIRSSSGIVFGSEMC